MLKRFLNIPLNEESNIETLNKIKKLNLPDGGYTFLPVYKNDTLKTKSDVYSTKSAIEVLYDLKAHMYIMSKEPMLC